jgi:PTH2 family peptidyl-tRNA hydrolase
MVFVINTSLKMSTGKIATQTAHAALSLFMKENSKPKKHLLIFNQLDIYVGQGQTKIVLKGLDDNQLITLEKQAQEIDLTTCLIRDAGRTEIPAGSITCLGIFGEYKQIDKITGTLKLLK